jgi:hypothetical protein
MCAAAAGIAGSINRHALSRVLATLGITKQPSHTTFQEDQKKLSPLICEVAKNCAANALQDVLRYLQQIDKTKLTRNAFSPCSNPFDECHSFSERCRSYDGKHWARKCEDHPLQPECSA